MLNIVTSLEHFVGFQRIKLRLRKDIV